MKKLILALLSVTSIILVSTANALAQKAVSLPVGELVRYADAECGQITGIWLPGTITARGQFISFQSSLATLKKQLKKAPKAKKRGITKKIKDLNKRNQKQSPICQQLGTGIVAPRSSQSPAAGATTINWTFAFRELNQTDIGLVRSYFCPPNGQPAQIYGSDTYTSDSAVCVAAVHAGIITFRFGGNVTLKIKPGKDFYLAGIRNGVASSLYNSWGTSYSFINRSTGAEYSSSAPVILPWSSDIALFGTRTGLSLTFICPANGSPGTIYGTDTYTNDSEVCSAAAHAGKTTKLKGGAVKVEVSTGLSSYRGSTRRGITSSSYGSWPGSIVFQ